MHQWPFLVIITIHSISLIFHDWFSGWYQLSSSSSLYWYSKLQIYVDLSREEQEIATRYPAHTAICIRDGWEFCRPELAGGKICGELNHTFTNRCSTFMSFHSNDEVKNSLYNIPLQA